MKSYNIYFPKFYNDGKPIPKTKMSPILNSIIEKFGVSTFQENATRPLVEGIWTSRKRKRFSDKVSVLCLILEDRIDYQKWFTAKAELWRQELKQEEFLIVVQYAEVIVATK